MKKVEKEGFNLYEVLGETMVMNNGLKAVVNFSKECPTMIDEEITALKVRKGEKFILVISSDFDKSGVSTKKGNVVINGLWEKARRWRKDTKHYTCDRVQVKYFEKSSGKLVGYGYITKADTNEEEDVTKVAIIPIFGIAVTICDKDNSEPDYVPKDKDGDNVHSNNGQTFSEYDTIAVDEKGHPKLKSNQRYIEVDNTYFRVQAILTDKTQSGSESTDDAAKQLKDTLAEWIDD